jgi:hypothetical protein
MKVTKLKESNGYCFEEIKIGNIFKFGNDFFLKFSEKGLADNDLDLYNAISIENGGYAFFERYEEVIPIESELIIYDNH